MSATPEAEDGLIMLILDTLFPDNCNMQSVDQAKAIIAMLRDAGHLRTPGTVEVSRGWIVAAAYLIRFAAEQSDLREQTLAALDDLLAATEGHADG